MDGRRCTVSSCDGKRLLGAALGRVLREEGCRGCCQCLSSADGGRCHPCLILFSALSSSAGQYPAWFDEVSPQGLTSWRHSPWSGHVRGSGTYKRWDHMGEDQGIGGSALGND